MPLDEQGVYHWRFTVDESALDGNGHVNNVVWVQWMQDAATRHNEECGGLAAANALNGTWVTHWHHVQYMAPAFAGDEIHALTWAADMSPVRSHRRYRFVNATTGQTLVRGETEWVFVNQETLRPKPIPREVAQCFVVQEHDPAE